MNKNLIGKNVSNKTIKNEKKNDDEKIINLFNELEDLKYNNKNYIFKKWLENSNIDEIKYKNIISQLCNDVTKVITENNFKITNEKQLKNEIATFIYSVSQ